MLPHEYAAALADAISECRITCKHEPSAFDLEQVGYDTIVKALRALAARPEEQTREAIIEECKKVLDEIYTKGPARGNVPWAQAWSSGVLDAHEAISALSRPPMNSGPNKP